MDGSFLPLIALVLGLALGAVAGWFFGSRPVEDWKQRFIERDNAATDREHEFKRAIKELGEAQIELAGAKERAARADELAGHLEKAREENSAFKAERAGFEEQKRLLTASQEKLLKEFENTGAKVLGAAQERFLARADERFKQSEEAGEQKIKALLNPVGKEFEAFAKKIRDIEEKRVGDYGNIEGLVKAMTDGQQRVIEGAHRIETTLRGATKAQGDWGELQFENLLESCGLRNVTDFASQISVSGEDGQLRPDAIINIPGNKKLVVDIKKIFRNYASANEAANDEERASYLIAHARQIRTAIDDLSGKRYQDHVNGSADFVVMFVPGEHVLYAALMQDSALLEYALQRQVVLSSPLNFMSIALTVATIWRQAGMQSDAKQIADLGKELYDRLALMSNRLAKVGNDLARTNKSFNSAVASFDSRLVPTGRKFKELSVDTSASDFESISPIEVEPRQLLHSADTPDLDEKVPSVATDEVQEDPDE